MMKENLILSPAVGQLLSLVRASLWQTSVEYFPFKDHPVDWDEIGKISMQQTVGALMANSAFSIPDEFLPSKAWLRKAFSFMECNRRSHLLLNGCIVDATAKLKESRIPSVLLKGQAYACVYPDPTLRQCGDIDIYVGEENFFRAFKASKDFGWKSEGKFNPKAKHYGCYLKDVSIELHQIAGQLPIPAVNKRFQDWSRHEIMSCQNTVVIEDKDIRVPSPIFDVIFVFMHLYLHFINGGIGLRHVCDWVMLLHAHYKEINIKELENRLKEFHLFREWRLFTPIAVRYLGLSEKECPFYSPEYNHNADRTLSFIIKEGNFGNSLRKHKDRPKGYIAGKAYSFKKNTSRLYSKFWIDPYTVIRYYCNYVKSGSKRVITDLLK